MRGKELIKTIIVDNQQRRFPEIWERKLAVPVNSGKIITLTGVRRSGKTYHLLNVARRLKRKGMNSCKLLYFNFEDERLDLTVRELDLILQTYQELYPKLDLFKCYFFFDEIQEIAGWEKFVTRLYETISKNVFVTGSNATLLSREIASALRGRTITYEVYPLSFREFVGVMEPNLNLDSSRSKVRLVGMFETFLEQGGFPELIKLEDGLKRKTLQEYFDVMVFRDLIERYEISQPTLLKYFCKRVIGNSAGEFSVNKIYNELKSQGYKVSKDTIYSFQEYVEAIYLTRFVSKYSHSVVKKEFSQKKIYVIDSGLGVALNYKLSQDRGRLLENTVALELIKQGKDISYFKNSFECDFVVVEKDKAVTAIQVTWDIGDKGVRDREVNGLVKACKQLGLGAGLILTFDQGEDFEEKGVEVKVMPAWRYFLSY